jgi:phosphotransferase system HPr (HPr) family protein
MVLKYTFPHLTAFDARKLLILSRAAVVFSSKITLRKGKTTADPKSFIEMLSMLEAKGRKLQITAEGEDAPQAVETLCQLSQENPKWRLN